MVFSLTLTIMSVRLDKITGGTIVMINTETHLLTLSNNVYLVFCAKEIEKTLSAADVHMNAG